MGWFDEQIKARRKQDTQNMQKSYQRLASVVDGHFRKIAKLDMGDKKHGALGEICKYFEVEMMKIPSNMKDLNDKMDFLLLPSGIMRRHIRLEGKWWENINGPLLCEKKGGTMVALFSGWTGTYHFFDYETGIVGKLNEESAKLFEPDAVCFYNSLPQKKVDLKELCQFMIRSFTKTDGVFFGLIAFIVVLVGMVVPAATAMLFSAILPSGKIMLVYTIAFMLVGVSVALFLLNTVQSTFRERIKQQMKIKVRSAMFARVLGLPVEFFKNYSSGDMAKRVTSVDQLCQIFCDTLMGTGITAIFSLTYIIQIFVIAPPLVIPATLILVIQIIIGIIRIVVQTKVSRKHLQADAELQGFVFSLFSGIQKIKLAGGESRAYAKWAKVYANKADAAYNPPILLKAQMAFAPAVTILGMYFIYRAAAGSVSLSQYMAFNTAYAMVSTAIISLLGSASSYSMVKPILEMAAPVLEAVPEIQGEKETLNFISGMIELNNVSFRYTKDGPWIIDNLNLKIERGQYVAIVGSTGCGKSTLLRLLLGFESPQVGAIYYDGKDLQKIEQRSFKKFIGVVLQNGKLFAGDIFSNISISAPQLTMEDAWKAAEVAGIAKDIHDMPMGMNTILSEGGGGVSGGQKQRLMIARAIAHKPKILMLDEATSALDNITQKKVSDSLESMKSTRIVIAHRLSTIRQCDRIIVLDQGRIIEDGTYEELSNKNGFFSKLVERQQINIS